MRKKIQKFKKSVKLDTVHTYRYSYRIKKENKLINYICGKNIKCFEGITLIGLVITIVVLIVFAGVSISLVAGENGILRQASSAVNKSKLSSLKEDISLAWSNVGSEYYANIGSR